MFTGDNFVGHELVLYRLGETWQAMGPFGKRVADRVLASLKVKRVPAFICLEAEFALNGLPQNLAAYPYYDNPPQWWTKCKP